MPCKHPTLNLPELQAENAILGEVGSCRTREAWMRSHPDLLNLLGIVNLEAGVVAAGAEVIIYWGRGLC